MQRCASTLKRDALLFTPGPLTTSLKTKLAMLRDVGSRYVRSIICFNLLLKKIFCRDHDMIDCISSIRSDLLNIARLGSGYDCILIPGSGTYSVESVISSFFPKDSKGCALVLINGAYGQRISDMLEVYNLPHDVLICGENKRHDLEVVERALRSKQFSHVIMVHHETTAGTLNDVDGVGKLLKTLSVKPTFFVDSMSGFGVHELDFESSGIDYMVSSANKNLEGVPGFSFVLANRETLERECTAQNRRSLSLDLKACRDALDKSGQFRFTPPTHALLAFRQALDEFASEGGCRGRKRRYEQNLVTLQSGMADLGAVEFTYYIICTYGLDNKESMRRF